MPSPPIRLIAMPLLALILTACGGSNASSGGNPAVGCGNASSSANASSSGTSSGSGASATTDVLTYHYDTMRTGQNLTETVLTPSNVNSSAFGLLHQLAADGAVDATPLVVSNLSINGSMHDVVYVASENDTV